jgi:hypothetical protein
VARLGLRPPPHASRSASELASTRIAIRAPGAYAASHSSSQRMVRRSPRWSLRAFLRSLLPGSRVSTQVARSSAADLARSPP